MSIVPASRLSRNDLALLGNNLGAEGCRTGRRRSGSRLVAAVNRSLAHLDERVARLHPLRSCVAAYSATRSA